MRIDGHHLRHWAQGGSTDLDNLVTICRAHHWRVHEGGWGLIRTDDGVVALPPVVLPPSLPQSSVLPPGAPGLGTSRARAPDAPPAV
ncbi:MAG: HNH endonuclease [Candidatus Dormibacteria bacterium]